MTLDQLNKIHLRLATSTDFCVLWLLYKNEPLYIGDLVNLMKLNSPESTDKEVQNMTNQLVRRNEAAGLIHREKTERLKNQPGRSSTLVVLNSELLQYYIQSLLAVEKDPQVKLWSDRYTHMGKTNQLFSQKYK